MLGKCPALFSFIQPKQRRMFNRKVAKPCEMFKQMGSIFEIPALEIA
jgi:hypothetical protein